MNAANHYLNEKSGKQATGTLRRVNCCGAAGASNVLECSVRDNTTTVMHGHEKEC